VATPFQVLTVLVVDDVRLARRIAARVLSEEGFRVLEADGMAEALEVLSEARGRVDLVLLDVVMPGGDGVTLAQSIAANWPAQRVLFMSAHPAEILARHGLQELDVPFLAKPYTRVELMTKVKAALRKPAVTDGAHPNSLVERRRNERLRGK